MSTGHAMGGVLAIGQIEVGQHPTATMFGMTFNLDTIWSTCVAGLVVILLGLLLRRQITKGTPGRVQLLWEGVVGQVQDQVERQMGPVAPFVVPLAVTLFVFIWVANWVEIIPTHDYLPSPTADTNLTFAMALLVIGWVHVTGVRKKGLVPYLKHFFQPYPLMFIFNAIEEIAKPLSLALRLFGNMFAGGLMITLIGALFPVWLLWAPNVAWKLFDMFIGLIQAAIFALLTIVYFSFAVRSEEA
ncbi:MAG: F0F1 ATP synthase subunit A [Streptosporangiaceae bacterium]